MHHYHAAFLGCALSIADGTLPILTADAVVARVERNGHYHTCVQTTPTGVRRLATILSVPGSSLNTPIHNIKKGSINNPGRAYAAVAVVDTGIDDTHPDLNVVFKQSFITGNPDPTDQFGHGTHCAGIIGALDNGIGVVGVAPGAPLWNIRVLDASGGGTLADVIAGMQFLAGNADQVRVINMSLGGGYSAVLNMAVAQNVSVGQIVVVAAGNSSVDAATFSPASEPSIICVAALADSDGLPGGLGLVTSAGNDDTFATFSNWGTLVKVIAPGVDILSTIPGGYGVKSGTSMATPHVAGLVTLLISAPSQEIRNVRFKKAPPAAQPRLTPAQVLGVLLQTSRENIPGIFDTRTYPLVCGKGF